MQLAKVRTQCVYIEVKMHTATKTPARPSGRTIKKQWVFSSFLRWREFEEEAWGSQEEPSWGRRSTLFVKSSKEEARGSQVWKTAKTANANTVVFIRQGVALLVKVAAHNGAKTEPRWSQDAPRGSQHRPKWSQEGANMSQNGNKTEPRGFKISNKKAKTMSCDIWHRPYDIWHMTCDMWHMTYGIWCMTIYDVPPNPPFWDRPNPPILLRERDNMQKNTIWLVKILGKG